MLRLLQVKGSATVADLAGALGVGQASVRRHLDHLRVDGLVDARVERHGVGRTAFVFYPTEKGEERAPAGYSRLLSRLYDGLRSLDEAQVQGRDGAQVLRTAFERVAERVAEEHRQRVTGKTVAERVAQTTDALQGEGIVDGWSEQGGVLRIQNSACPYRQAAVTTHGTCELDRRAIELLVSAPVRQVSRIVDGQPTCEYIVQALRRDEQTHDTGRQE